MNKPKIDSIDLCLMPEIHFCESKYLWLIFFHFIVTHFEFPYFMNARQYCERYLMTYVPHKDKAAIEMNELFFPHTKAAELILQFFWEKGRRNSHKLY